MIVSTFKEFDKRFPSWKKIIQLVGLSAIALGAGDALPTLLNGTKNLSYRLLQRLSEQTAVPVRESPFVLGFHSIVVRDDSLYYGVFAGECENGFEVHIAKSEDSDTWEDAEIIRYAFDSATEENMPKSLQVTWDDSEPNKEHLKIVWGEDNAVFHTFGSFDRHGNWNGSHSERIVQ